MRRLAALLSFLAILTFADSSQGATLHRGTVAPVSSGVAAIFCSIGGFGPCAQLTIVGSPLACPQGTALPDGCPGANPASGDQVASAFSPGGYFNTKTGTATNYTATRPPNNVAFVDFPVGAFTPVGMDSDPVTATIPGCTHGTSTHGNPELDCTGSSFVGPITALNFGAAFGHACTVLNIDPTGVTASKISITNNHFTNDGNCGYRTFQEFMVNAGSFTYETDYMYNSFNGNGIVFPYNTCNNTADGGATCSGAAALNTYGIVQMKYNSFINFAARTIYFNIAPGQTTDVTFDDNYVEGFDYHPFNGHVEFIVGNPTVLGGNNGPAGFHAHYNTIVQTTDGMQFGPGDFFLASNWAVDYSLGIDIIGNTIINGFMGGASYNATVSGCVGATFSSGVCSGAGTNFWVTAISPPGATIGHGEQLGGPQGGPLCTNIVGGASVFAWISAHVSGGQGVGSEWTLDSGTLPPNLWTAGPATCTNLQMWAVSANTYIWQGSGFIRHVDHANIQNNYVDGSSSWVPRPATGQVNVFYSLSGNGVNFNGTVSGTALTYNSGTVPSIGHYVVGAGITGCTADPTTCPTIVSGTNPNFVLSSSGGTVGPEAMSGEFPTVCATPANIFGNTDMAGIVFSSVLNSPVGSPPFTIGCVPAPLTPPTITPQVSAYFNQNQTLSSNMNNVLRPNNNAAGAFEAPTTATQSVTFYGEAQINPTLGTGQAWEVPLGGMEVSKNGVGGGSGSGQPTFVYQRGFGGQAGTNWSQSAGNIITTGASTAGGSGYNSGIYPFTTTGGGCSRQPTGVWNGGGSGGVRIVDPGFGCQTTPTIDPVNIPGDGAQQVTNAGGLGTTCAVVGGLAQVTAHVAVPHGLTPGRTYVMGGFTPSGYNSASYTAVSGTTGTTLVGTTGATSCPAVVSVEGTALNGTGLSITWPAVTVQNTFGPTGVTTRNGQHICFALGEYGSDSVFPGGHFFSAVDENGNPLPGAPALIPILNQGTANFTGYTTVSSATLNVTAMNSYALSAVTWTSINQVNFTTTTSPGFIDGSEFTVSGVTPSAYNGTYVATSAVGGGGSAWTFTGNKLTGTAGVPQGIASNPGAGTVFGSLVSVIMPGMQVLGATSGTVILPYATPGFTGTGGVGTYGLTVTQASAIGSIGAPVNIFAFSAFYYSAVAGGAGGGTVTARTQSAIGDFLGPIGSSSASALAFSTTSWGGTLANLATFHGGGGFPQQAGGAPSTAALASLCTKSITLPAFAAANGLTLHALYELNDPGIWGESSLGDFKGTINGTALAITSTPLPATLASGTTISGVGITGCPLTCPTVSTGSGSSYTLNTSGSASLIGPESLKAGLYKPATPLTNSSFQGFLAANTLTVTSYPTGNTTATFTGSLSGSTLTVSGVTGNLQAGELITDGGVNLTGPPLLLQNGGGSSWPVLSNYYPMIASETMTASLNGLVPGNYVLNSSITTPIKITGYGTGNGFAPPTPAQTSGVTYTISNPAGLTIGSLGSPVTFTTTSIQDGAPVAPGPALTIRDQGPGIELPVTFGAGTGTIPLSGTFNTATLGGTPSTIQTQISLSVDPAQGPVPGCSACAWTTVTGYTATLSSGTTFNWKGSAINIPASSGPLYVSVRAANGTAYATAPNYFKIGVLADIYGEGTTAFVSGQAGFNIPTFSKGLWGGINWQSQFGFNEAYLAGPPVLGNWVPVQSAAVAGDHFGFNGSAQPPLPEGVGAFDQTMTNATGWPTSYLNLDRDGIGMLPFTLGNTQQAQTIGLGTGSLTTWCSSTTFCPNASPSAVSVAGPLYYNAASMTGATLVGASIAGTSPSTLTVPATTGLIQGALMPGLILNVGTNVTLQYCLTGCAISNGTGALAQTWALSNTSANGLVPTRADPSGGAPWPAAVLQNIHGLPFSLEGAGFGKQLIKAGTFSISVNGAVVCTDTGTFAYNNTGGNCTGATIASSFVNYQTGDYQIAFTSAPASSAVVTATWTNIISPEGAGGTPQGLDFVGDGTFQSGPVSSQYNRAPGGVSAHIFQSGQSDWANYISGPGYQLGAVGYTQMISDLFTRRYPSIFPNASATTPFMASESYREEGNGWTNFNNQGEAVLDQWAIDVVTKSTFSGSIASSVLTLGGSAAVGPMWEGEVIGGASMQSPTGITITKLASGTWGAAGSTYNLAGASGVTASGAMFNDVYWKGSGPTIYGGPLNDITVQNQGLNGTTLFSPHGWVGEAGGRRVGARLAALLWGGLSSTPVAGVPPANASAPTLDRVKADAINCDAAALAAPCFAITGFASTATASWTTGGVFTVTGGLAAHALPFVLGQSVTCSPSCGTNLVITSVDHPPTQDTRTGQGQVAQTFTFQVSGTVTSNSSGTVTAGCSGVSGTNSNCILIAYKINTTAGTFGTTPALATCGENNLNGSSVNYIQPTGPCIDNGIGTLVRNYRIGTVQSWATAGRVYDDGVDFYGIGAFHQNQAFTCNIAAALVVRCVKGSSTWSAGSTFISGGDADVFSGRIASVVGYVGGQSFPFTPGSGYTNGTTQPTVTCSPMATGFPAGIQPKFDVTVAGGAITNVYPSSNTTGGTIPPTGTGVGGTCTVALPAGGTGGAIPTIQLAPVEGIGGVTTYNTDSNTMGLNLYGDEGFIGNPLHQFFDNGMGGYFEPGLGVQPFGQMQGTAVSG